MAPEKTMTIRVLHIIAGLGLGGAEMSLLKLLSAMDKDRFVSSVVSLTSDPPLGELIRRMGVLVSALTLTSGLPDPRLILKLVVQIRRQNPDIIQTWMYHSDFLGGLAAQLAGSPPVIWNIRHTYKDHELFKPGTRWIIRLNARLSHSFPACIICNSEASRESHIALGFDPEKMIVIPNGFDTDIFHRDLGSRREIRRELAIDNNSPIIGLCARFHPDKDHDNFFKAARILCEQVPAVEFLLWGKGMDGDNPAIIHWLKGTGFDNRFHLLGERFDSTRLFSSLDIFTLSSSIESFPGVIGEAMASEVICVATDVGDMKNIVGDTGIVVPAHDHSSLAEGWKILISLPPGKRAELGKEARQRIIDHFGQERTTGAYSKLYQDIIAG